EAARCAPLRYTARLIIHRCSNKRRRVHPHRDESPQQQREFPSIAYGNDLRTPSEVELDPRQPPSIINMPSEFFHHAAGFLPAIYGASQGGCEGCIHLQKLFP